NLAFLVNRGSFSVESSGSSGFESGDGTDVESGATNNAIAVTATELRFSSVPSAVNIDTDFGLTVSATDANGNIDTDNTISVTLARGAGAGILSSVAGLTQSLSSGTFDWTDLQYNTTETFDITTTSSLTDATSSSIVAQNITTIAFQDFEGGADDWSFTPNPTTYNVSDDIWANVTTVGGTVSAANSGSNFWGMEDLENSNGGGAFDHTLTFATINTSSATSVSISFDYITDDFNGSDILKYEIFEDGVGQGQVNLPQNTDAWTTVSVNISDAADNAHIVITASQNGGSQHAGVDNFKIEGAVAVVAGTSTVAAGAGAEPSTISSLINAATDASLNFDFAITDDGATSGTDTDDLLINQVEISQGTGNDIADWTTVIAGAYLVNGDDSVAATVSASLLTFASIPTTSTDLGFVADNATKTFELKVYLANPLPAGVDGSNLAFSVNRGSFSVESSGSSGFESGNGTDVESGASNNAIAITATELRFSSVPSDVFVNTNFGLTVSATDANGNTDTDNTTSVTLARGAGAGTLSSTTGLTQSLSSGTFSWTDLQNNTIETFDITTTSSLTDATSSSITASAIPTLIIAEVADPSNNSNARFVKLYNNGTDTLDFDTETYFLSRQANGTSWGDFQLSGTLAPGATMVVATNSSNFNTAYGFTPDLTSGFISGNGDDTYAIFKDGGNSSGTLLDIYGEIDVDGTGDPWEYEDSRAVRIPGNTPNTTWTASEWVITSANVADFTPSTFGYYSASSGNLNTLATWGLNKDGSSTNPTDFTSANQQFHVYNNASPAVSASWTISGTNSKLVIGDGSTTISFGLASGQTLTVVNLEVQASGTLEANDGAVVTFSGDLINDGTITVKEDAAFIQSAASPSNSGSGTYEVERTAPDYKFHFNFWSSPLENLNIGNAFSSAQNIYGYNASTQAWSGANTAYTLAAGEGFIATGLSESATTILRTFSSTNAFNSGDIDVALTFNSDANDDNDWNLIGNPYPSGLSANSFLTDNSGVIDNAVYLWNSDGDDETSLDSDYATMNAAGVTGGGGGTTPSSNNIASCQGFFVQATGAGSVTFSNAQRTSTNNTFLRTQEVEMQRIWLGVSAQTKEANYPFTNEVLIGFMEDAENSKDKYDANKFKGHAHLSMYSLMEDKKLAIQGLPLLEDDQLGATRMVPIGIEVGLAGQYTFSINMLKNVPAAYDVLFYDALANTWTDLRAHSYTVPIKNTGEYNDRFSLHLVGNRVTSLPTDQPAAGIHVYAFESAVYIAPTAQVKGGIQVVITDLMGRTILDQAFSALSTKEKISLAAYPQGIYLVKVVAEEGKVVKRVYIK
ncbi:MAG: lamin tail domain-containing protein, partial [Flammeovirgaceae bacterium]